MRAWNNHLTATNLASGGHVLEPSSALRLFPIRFQLRHCICLSQESSALDALLAVATPRSSLSRLRDLTKS
jgi:hypothetical protein